MPVLPAILPKFVALTTAARMRLDLVDWNNDGVTDLILGDSTGKATFFRNTGTATDPEARVTVTPQFFESRSGNSAFLGKRLLGKASEVLVGGYFALRNGKVVG